MPTANSQAKERWAGGLGSLGLKVRGDHDVERKMEGGERRHGLVSQGSRAVRAGQMGVESGPDRTR